jgi:hypothetical protein
VAVDIFILCQKSHMRSLCDFWHMCALSRKQHKVTQCHFPVVSQYENTQARPIELLLRGIELSIALDVLAHWDELSEEDNCGPLKTPYLPFWQ